MSNDDTSRVHISRNASPENHRNVPYDCRTQDTHLNHTKINSKLADRSSNKNHQPHATLVSNPPQVQESSSQHFFPAASLRIDLGLRTVGGTVRQYPYPVFLPYMCFDDASTFAEPNPPQHVVIGDKRSREVNEYSSIAVSQHKKSVAQRGAEVRYRQPQNVSRPSARLYPSPAARLEKLRPPSTGGDHDQHLTDAVSSASTDTAQRTGSEVFQLRSMGRSSVNWNAE
jgi:hypothetical protein